MSSLLLKNGLKEPPKAKLPFEPTSERKSQAASALRTFAASTSRNWPFGPLRGIWFLLYFSSVLFCSGAAKIVNYPFGVPEKPL